MSHLADTDVVVDYLKGRPAVITLLQTLARDRLAISVITFGEVYEGIYFARTPAPDERAFLEFLALVEILPVTEEIMKHFARARGALRRRGQRISDTDMLIAATALHHDLTLLTRNRRDFARVPDLRLWQDNP